MNFYTEEKPDIWWQDGMRCVYDQITQAFDPTTNSETYGRYAFAWGGSMSQSAIKLQQLKTNCKKVWFYAGGTFDLPIIHDFDIVFCEDKWSQREFRKRGVDAKIAFGINTKVYYKIEGMYKLWNYIYPAAFAGWKRHSFFVDKVLSEGADGLCVGQLIEEEKYIYEMCMREGVTVIPKATPEIVNWLYNQSECAYLPAEIFGGCQRALMEARYIGLEVIVEDDNPRLKEMLNDPVKTEVDYFNDVIKVLDNE